ncbi:hypothetical protein [Lysobacter sp. CA199]|uniref:hypothetical protein n=1 Tax=Lysobacter sp. CA199 TaxID=3455608 RepID=UPI003F8D3E7D
MPDLPLLDLPALRALAYESIAIVQDCACVRPAPLAWTSMSMELPQSRLDRIATLVAAADYELSVEEYHPHDTHYWSADAPIAIDRYPCNHCDVWRCRGCGRCFLHYTEGGGYFVDRRIRLLDPALIVELSAPG